MIDVAVVGGGPAGMLCAMAAGRAGASVVLFERNEKLGKKLYITGKGRCNVTNAAEGEELMRNILRNPRFLYSALSELSNIDLQAMLEGLGVPLKVERGGRVFPVSDRASDVTRALERALRAANVAVRYNARVTEIAEAPNGFRLTVNGESESAAALVLATGGVSYPTTGSTGDGHRMAEALGHDIAPLRPGLTSLETEESWPGELSGLSLKNVALSGFDPSGKRFFQEQGEMLFTHYGVSGPLVLSLSSSLPEAAFEAFSRGECGATLALDLKPALDERTLDARLVRDLAELNRKQISAVLDGLMPRALGGIVARLAEIAPARPANTMTGAQRRQLLTLLKRLPLRVRGVRGWEEAIITRGGVRVGAVNPSTLMSKRVPGLFFAGELLDVDALTGGFNLQIAFSTGALAGKCAAQYASERANRANQ